MVFSEEGALPLILITKNKLCKQLLKCSHLNLHKVHGLHEPGGSSKHTGVETPSSGGNDLTTTSVDSVSVQGDVIDVETHATHVLISKDTLLGSPLEASHNRVLDLVQVLDSLSAVHKNVGASGVRAEAPDLSGLGHVILVLVSQVTTTSLEVVSGVNLTLKEKSEQL